MSIEIIIAGCLKKDPKCQAALVKKYAPTLINICKRYVYDPDLAYDAMQECFMNVFKYLDKYSGKGSFDGWIKRIAVNCALAVRKKMKGDLFVDEMDQVLNISTDIPSAVSNLNYEEMMQYVDALPDSCSIVFKLYVIEGYPHKEIADMLGIKESSSRSQLARAREKLIAKFNGIAQMDGRRMENLLIQAQRN